MESSPESMRGASAAMVVPVTSAAMAVSSSRRVLCERALALAATGSLTFRFFYDLLDCGTLAEDRGFDGPTAARSSPRKLALEEACTCFA